MIRNDSREILVAVATYNRNVELSLLLDSLADQAFNAPFSVVIVDNSPDMAAKPVADRSDLSVVYRWEPAPGVVSARNHALRMVEPRRHKAIAFVDDDEIADENWLRQLQAAMEHFGADVVSGPVISEIPASAPAWVTRGGFFQRPRRKTGQPVDFAATNNVLVSVDAWVRLGTPIFDPDFNFTGGEDSDFFYRLRRAGARMVWCDEALVEERIPESRISAKWLWTRIYWGGNVAGQLELREYRPLRVLTLAGARVAVGILRTGYSVLTGRGIRMSDVKLIPQGVGRISALRGKRIKAYARPDDGTANYVAGS